MASVSRALAMSHADRIIALRDGHVVADAPVGRVHPDTLEWIYRRDRVLDERQAP